MKKIFTIILTLLILIGGQMQPSKVYAEDNCIYISSGGSDETGDGSMSAPFQTLNKVKEYLEQHNNVKKVYVMSTIEISDDIDFPNDVLFIPENIELKRMFNLGKDGITIHNIHINGENKEYPDGTILLNIYRKDLSKGSHTVIDNITIDGFHTAGPYAKMDFVGFGFYSSLTVNNCKIFNNDGNIAVIKNPTGGDAELVINGGDISDNNFTNASNYRGVIDVIGCRLIINNISIHNNTNNINDSYGALVLIRGAIKSAKDTYCYSNYIQINGGSYYENSISSVVRVSGGDTYRNKTAESVLEVNGGVFKKNTITSNGAIITMQPSYKWNNDNSSQYYIDNIKNPIGKLYINGGEVSENIAAPSSASPTAGVYNGPGSTAIITKMIIKNNSNERQDDFGPFSGGGIYNDGYMELYNAAVVNNISSMDEHFEEKVSRYSSSMQSVIIKGAGIGTCPTSNNYLYLDDGLFLYGNTNPDGLADISIQNKYTGNGTIERGFFNSEKFYISSHTPEGVYINLKERDNNSLEEKEFTEYGKNNRIRDITLYSDVAYTEDELNEILSNYDVIIYGNSSTKTGGGIGSNGTLVFGSKDSAVKELNIAAECHECIVEQPDEITATVYDKNNDKIKEVKLLKEEGYTATISGLADLDGYYVVQDSLGSDIVANISTSTDVEVQNDITIKKLNFSIKNECDTKAQGTSARLKKYLVVDSDSEIPETEFMFTVSAGQGNDPATNSAVVYSGLEPEKVKVNGTAQTGKVKFNAGDTKLNGALDGVATADQKYAVKDIILDFSEVQFAEPAVYRYILTEQSNDWSAINNDPEPIRVVDVHIIWNEDETQLIVGGYVGYYGNVTDSPKLLPENYLEEEPIYVYGNLYSGGLYGASSSDMHLSYGDWDNIAFGNYYIYEDYFSQDIPRPPDPYEIAISALGLDEQGNINTGEVKNAFIFKFFSYNHIDYTEEELESFVGDNRFIEQNLNTGQYTIYDVDIIVYDYDGEGDYYDCPPSYCTHPRLMTYRYRRHIEDGSGKPAGSYVNAQEPIGVEAGEKSDKYVNGLDTANLLLAKNVSGNQSSRNQYFEFNVTVNNAGKNTILTLDTSNAETSTHANNATEYTTQVMNAANTRDDDISRPGQQIIADDSGGVSFKVYLHHGQSITLKGIPKDATYSIIETSSAGYTTTSENSSGTITSEDVIVSFLNHRSGVVPTGTNIISSLKFLVIPITLIGYFLISKRNKDDEE